MSKTHPVVFRFGGAEHHLTFQEAEAARERLTKAIHEAITDDLEGAWHEGWHPKTPATAAVDSPNQKGSSHLAFSTAAVESEIQSQAKRIHGQPAKRCEQCGGSGLSGARIDTMPPFEPLCSACAGTGMATP